MCQEVPFFQSLIPTFIHQCINNLNALWITYITLINVLLSAKAQRIVGAALFSGESGITVAEEDL